MAGHFIDTVEDVVTGKPVNGATVLVYVDGATISDDDRSVTSGTLATIYSDDGSTQIDQASAPVTTRSDGEFDFYTDETRVVIAILYNGAGKTVWNDVDILGGSINSDVTALAARVDKHDTLIGTAANATSLGTFTGSTIGDNEDVKTALQDLETAVEGVVGGSGGIGDVVGPASATDGHLAVFDGTTGKLLKDGGSPGSGGGAWNLQFGPLYNEAPASSYATLDTRNGHPTLDFDDTTAESAVFSAVLPNDYSGAGVTVILYWSATSATSGDVMWQVAFEAMAGQDTDSDSFATARDFAASTANGTSGILTKVSLNVSDGANMDSIAAGTMFRIKITRNAASGSDTMSGDAELMRVMVVSQ